jgi:hypothetical protein
MRIRLLGSGGGHALVLLGVSLWSFAPPLSFLNAQDIPLLDQRGLARNSASFGTGLESLNLLNGFRL